MIPMVDFRGMLNILELIAVTLGNGSQYPTYRTLMANRGSSGTCGQKSYRLGSTNMADRPIKID